MNSDEIRMLTSEEMDAVSGGFLFLIGAPLAVDLVVGIVGGIAAGYTAGKLAKAAD